MRHLQILLLTFLLFTFIKPLEAQNSHGLFINEFMASNSTTIQDPDYGDFADWIEIHNSSDSAINLNGFYISDNLNQLTKYRINSNSIIEPGGYILIWADDSANGLHTNFKLSADGESIAISSPAGVLIDSLRFGPQQTDISTGRFPETENNFYQFRPATPGTSNLESGIYNRAPKPEFSIQGGFYPSQVVVTLTSSLSGSVIRYTLNGTNPDSNSPVYSAPLTVDSTTVVKASVFKSGLLPSKPEIHTFLINENTQLPVFSISTDPANFFSDTSGIYVIGTNGIVGYCSSQPRNWNQDWERPVTIEFFEQDKTLAFKVDAGVSIYGGCTRLYNMKSLGLYFRKIYGPGKLPYKIFPNLPFTEYNNLILRSSGQDWWRSMFRDALIQSLTIGKMNVDYQEYRPSIVFINGQYWGIHNIREKMNEHYPAYRHSADIENLDVIQTSSGRYSAFHGDSVAFYQLYNYISNNDLSKAAHYEYVSNLIDIDEYIDYNITQIYSANGDWPGSNLKIWREKKPGAKWRWMLYDLDFGFGGNAQGQANTNTLEAATATNGPSWPNPPWSTLILRKLLTNTEFKNEFIQRFAVHMSTTYRVERVNAIIDSLRENIAFDIPRHQARWPQSTSFSPNWDAAIQLMRDFALNRASNIRGHIYSKFGVTGANSLFPEVNNDAMGRIIAHGKPLDLNKQSIFFKSVPLKLRALPNPGYVFVRWEGASNSTSESIELILTSNTQIKAIFERATITSTVPVINEINYKSRTDIDAGDWVEIFNPTEQTVNLNGWKIRDAASNSFTFSVESTIPALGYIALVQDSVKFRNIFGGNINVAGNFSFGLSSSSETVNLVNPAGDIVNSVSFTGSNPWPEGADGTGFTIELINPAVDNKLPVNWQRSFRLSGTPGALNDVFTKIEDENTLPNEYQLSQNYPNPFNPETRIQAYIKNQGFTSLKLYDILGSEVMTIFEGDLIQGYHYFDLDGRNLSGGVYIYVLRSGSFVAAKKLVLLK